MGRSQSGMHSNALDMKTIKFFILSFFLVIQSCSNNYVEQEMTNFEIANHKLEEMITDSDTPGLQYMIVNSDSIIFEFTGGLSNLENMAAFSPGTTINAFSVTKTFTSLSILKLEEDKKLSIDDYVQNYLDDLPYKTNFSIRQVLNHTSGLPNPIPLKWAHLLNEHESFNYKEFVKNVLTENDELDNIPGKKYSYSNIGYLILGELIERVSGKEYRSYVKNNIIQNLYLSDEAYLDFVIEDTLNQCPWLHQEMEHLKFWFKFCFR